MMVLDQGLRALAGRFDGYIVDLWGVVHDGIAPYAGALDCLARLRAGGKPVVLLSNAPRRVAVAVAVAVAGLRALGVPDDAYDAIMTSGEATYQALAQRPDGWFEALGRRVFHLGPERDGSVFAGLDLARMQTPEGASFVLNTGPDDARGPADQACFDDLLARCRAAGLPMLCANPDLVVHRGDARLICAGTLAQRYAALGGDVRCIGKPDPLIYRDVLGLLGLPAGQVLAVGDSLRTDIAGAKAAGIAAVWVLGGIHAELDLAAARQAATAADLSPIGIMDRSRF